MHLVRVLASIIIAIAGAGACAAPREGPSRADPVEAAYAAGMTAAELAKGPKQETVHGWRFEIVGPTARFFACSDVETCSERLVEMPAKSVVAVRHVGRARPVRVDGSELDETDVVRLTIAKEVVPSRGGVATDPHRGLVVGVPAKR